MDSQMDMPGYEVYKESGAEWIGEIPVHWDLTKLATRFEERRTKVSDKVYPPLSVTKNGILPQLDNAAKTNDGDNRKLVKTGDFVINSRSDRKGSSGISDRDGSVSLINIILEPQDIHPQYCNYLLKSYSFIEEFYRMGHGIVADLWTTRYDEMKAVTMGIPPILEQTAIANFLDRKTAQIDQAIAIKEKQIALLKERKQILIQNAVTRGLDPTVPMKDSGVEWIGEIPEHWDMMYLKRLTCLIQTGPFGTQLHVHDYVVGGVPLINPKHMKSGKLAPEENCSVDVDTADRLSQYMLRNGDLILARRGELGRCAVVSSAECGWLCGTGSLMIRFNLSSINIEYVYWVVANEGTAELLKLDSVGSTMDNLNTSIIGNLLVPVPPKDEQSSIIVHIETESSKIEESIVLQQQQIQKLKEYKATLINSAVTGKIKIIQEEQPNQPTNEA